jgi:hypothetical protein
MLQYSCTINWSYSLKKNFLQQAINSIQSYVFNYKWIGISRNFMGRRSLSRAVSEPFAAERYKDLSNRAAG